MTFPVAIMEFRFDFFQTIIWTNIGGILGIYFFAFLSDKIIQLWRSYVTPIFKRRHDRTSGFEANQNKKIFTKRSRRVIRIKNKYGLIGIAASTPILLSIPVGVFLVVRYFGKKKIKFSYLIGSNIIWSFIYALFYTFCYESYLNLIS